MYNLNKKGDIWVSTVIYIAISIIVIAIVLLAALPLIQKLKDRNVTMQTKNILTQIDKNIKEVISSGPGAKRVISPVIIDAGLLEIDFTRSAINWTMKTKDALAEPGLTRQEGSVFIVVNERRAGGSIVEGEFEISQYLSYASNPELKFTSNSNSLRSPFTGRFTMSVRYIGTETIGGQPTPKLEINMQ